MALSSEEARVLASLVEKEASVPDSYPMTLNALRLACNQSTNREPITAYDDRTVDTALLSLKSQGLVRFVHPSHGGRTTRYRHCADERWRLDPAELGVLAMLVLRGPQTSGELRNRASRHVDDRGTTVDDALDALASRRPEPLATRLERRPGEREVRFAHLLTGEVDLGSVARASDSGAPDPGPSGPTLDEVVAELAQLRQRLERLETELGLTPNERVSAAFPTTGSSAEPDA